MIPPFPITAGDALRACKGRLLRGDVAQPLTRFSTDTRALQAGDTFIALIGPNFDGHAFVQDAVTRGAAALIVSQRPALDGVPLSIAAIEVDDTLQALQAIAQDVRRRSRARVVAITGSAGKTTTKEATAAFLAERFRTMRNRGNLNNHVGLPLSLLELQAGAEVAVVELGMNHAGEISRLVEIAEPDVRVWTNVGTAHIGHFGSMDAIAAAKAEVLQGATSDTVFVANANDPRVMARVPAFPGRTLTFGIGVKADVAAGAIDDRGIEGQVAEVTTRAGTLRLSLRLPGRGHLANVLAATAVALHFGVPIDAIARCASELSAGAHRGELLHLSRGVRLLDDCYNSSPGALQRTLEVVAATPTRGPKIAVLGEMLELGDLSEALHRECGKAVASAGVTRLIAVGGPPARVLGEAAVEAGMAHDAVDYVTDGADATGRVIPWLEDDSLVVVKGSRGIRLERVVDRLRAELG